MQKACVILVLLTSLVLVACSPSGDEAAVAAEPTQTSPTATPPPTPEPSPTPLPEPTLSPEEMSQQLFDAVEDGDLDAIQALIDAGVDLTQPNDREQPVIVVAAQQDDPLPMLNLLVSAEADVNAPDPRLGTTALILTAANMEDRGNVVSYLLDQGAEVDAIGGAGATALTMAAQNGNSAVVEQLILAGANVNHVDASQYKQHPIHWAAKNGHADIVAQLLDAGVNVDAVENTNSSAIFYAAYYGHAEVVEQLLAAGADLTIRDSGGQTALRWANSRGEEAIAQMIEDAGGTE